MSNINEQLQSIVDNNDVVLFMKGVRTPRNADSPIRPCRFSAISTSISKP